MYDLRRSAWTATACNSLLPTRNTFQFRNMLASLLHPSSYLGFFVFIAATGCGMPIPEEAAIVVAGVLSSQQQLDWRIAFAVCLAGAVVGDSFMYAIGYRW